MTILGNIPFSATTATIEFGGKEVGQLQNLTWDENHNLRRIPEIGSSVPVAILKGVSEYNLRANKAFIDADLVANLVRGASIDELVDNGADAEQVSLTGRARTGILNAASDDLTDSVTNALTTGSSIILPSQKVINLFFEVKIKSLSSIDSLLDRQPSDAVGELTTKDLLSFKECSIQSRSARMDIGALVVMQDVNIMALHLQYGNA